MAEFRLGRVGTTVQMAMNTIVSKREAFVVLGRQTGSPAPGPKCVCVGGDQQDALLSMRETQTMSFQIGGTHHFCSDGNIRNKSRRMATA